MTETKKRLNDIFVKVLDKPDLLIEHYMTSNDIEGWDSFNHLRLIMFIEKEFNIQIDGTEVLHLKSVSSLINHIEKKAGTPS